MARALFESRVSSDRRTLWFEATDFERNTFAVFESSLGLAVPLTELLPSTEEAAPVLILNGADRLYSDHAFRTLAMLLGITRQGATGAPWRIVLPCQSQDWPRVSRGLERAGLTGISWKAIEVRRMTQPDLLSLAPNIPNLAKLLLSPQLAALFGNLQILDLVTRRLLGDGDVDPTNWLGETSVAAWFWEAEVGRGNDSFARGKAARALAERQAETLTMAVQLDDFSTADVQVLQSLSADRICALFPGDRIGFEHDLYGDWARLRLLITHRNDLPAFVRTRMESPLWHRALRLFSLHLLENERDVNAWRQAMASLATDEFAVVRDLFIEAPVFAASPAVALEALKEELFADGATLLQRFLRRFLIFATIPNPEMIAVARSFGIEEDLARATYRLPYWPYWLDVLRFLHRHRTVIVSTAAGIPTPIAQVVELWLKSSPLGTVLRLEAADIGLQLGLYAIETGDVLSTPEWC